MQQDPFTILYEDRDIIVCTKPHGLPVQSRRPGTPDLESMLKTYLARQNAGAGTCGREPYLAVIHRLDQPVSGILVFARTKKSAASLNAQLQTDGFGKYYRALVDGTPPAPAGTCTDYLVRDGRTNTSRVCSPDTPGARKALLEYRAVAGEAPFFPGAGEGQTELEVHLRTGRHHQIRVQLAHMGCPISGDTKYGRQAPAGGWQTLKLCACRLSFSHPSTGKEMSFRLEQDIL